MFQAILRLSRHTLIYGIGHVLTRLIPFALLPFMTYYLPPDQFGIQALYYILIAVAMEIVRLGLDIALLRFYVPEKDPVKQREIFSSIFWAAFIVTGLLSAMLWFGAEFWVKLIVEHLEPYPGWMIYTLKLCAVIIWLDNMSAFPLVVMRAENRPNLFIITRLTGVAVHTGMTLALLIIGRGVPGIFEGNLIGSALMLVITLPIIIGRLRFVFNKATIIACLAFGLPNVPNVLFVQVVELSGRKIIEMLRTVSEAGLYSAGCKLGMFLAIVAMGFRYAWQPFFLQIKDKPDARDIYGRVLTYYMAVVLWMYLLLTAFVEPLAKWNIPVIGRSFIHPEYWQGIAIFPVVSLAHVFNGMFAVFIVGIYLEKKTKVLPWITGVAALVNIGGNILLVPHYGMWAAAWLTVVSYFMMAGLLYVYVQRIYPIRYEWRRVMHLTVIAGLVFVVGIVGRDYGFQWFGYALSVIYPLLLLITGLATQGELSRIGLRKRKN